MEGQTSEQQTSKTHPSVTAPLCLSAVINLDVNKGQYAVVDNVLALGGIGPVGLGHAALLYGWPPGA